MEMRQAPPQPESATPERYRLQPVQEQNKGIVGWLKSKMTNESPRQIMQELAARPSPLTSTETESFRTQYKREVMTPEQINDALATKRVEYQSVTDLHDSKKVHEIPQPILENRLNAYKQEVATLQGRLQKMQAEPNTNPQDLHKLQTEINRASHTLKGLERTATARQPIIDNLKTALNDPNIPNYELAMYMTMNPAQSDKVSPKDFRYDVRAQAARGALQTRMKSADSGTLQRWSDGIDPKRESDPHRRHAMEALKSMVNTEITTKTKAAEAKVAQIRAEAAPVSTDPKVTPEVSPTPAPAEVVAPPATETAADLPINDQARKDKVKQKILDGYLEWKSKNQGLLDAGGEAAEEAEIQAIDNLGIKLNMKLTWSYRMKHGNPNREMKNKNQIMILLPMANGKEILWHSEEIFNHDLRKNITCSHRHLPSLRQKHPVKHPPMERHQKMPQERRKELNNKLFQKVRLTNSPKY